MTDAAAAVTAGLAQPQSRPPRLLAALRGVPLLVRRGGGLALAPLTAAAAAALLLAALGWPMLLAAQSGGRSSGRPSAVMSLRSASDRPLVNGTCGCSMLCSKGARAAHARARAHKASLRTSGGQVNDSLHRRLYWFYCAWNNPCTDRAGDLWAAIVVTSATVNWERREAIRSTWASEAAKLGMGVVFLTGLTTDEVTLKAMAAESDRHGDLIVGDFLDSYNLLTVKSVAMLRWAMVACPRARYLVKADDDMYVSLSHLQTTLQAHAANLRSIIGNKRDHLRVMTGSHHKWRDPFYLKHYGKVYPPYVSGTTYVIAMSIVAELFRASQVELFDRMEDVFITGICARRIGNVTHVRHSGFSTRQRSACSFASPSAVTAHHMTPSAMRDVWSKLNSNACTAVRRRRKPSPIQPSKLQQTGTQSSHPEAEVQV